MYFISQFGEHDCLFTCLTMMLANYHHDKKYLFLPHQDRCYNYQEILEEGKKYQLTLLGVKVSSEQELVKCNSFPIIVTLSLNSRTKHSVLLYKVTKKYCYYYDPANGKHKESLSSFADKWTKRAIIVEKCEKMTCPITPPDFVAKKDKITLPIFQLISGLALLSGTYFVDSRFPIYVPIILFSAFIIFELLFRQNLINAMKRIDENIAKYDLRCEKENYYSFYRNVTRYQNQALTWMANIIYSILIIAFVIFIMLINSRYNAIYILMAVLIAAIEVAYFLPYFDKKSHEVETDEYNVKNAENDYEFNHFSKEAREKAYKLGLNKTVFSYVSIAMMLLVIIVVMATSSTINVTYIVFYLCITVFLKSEFSKLFTYSTTNEEFDSVKNKVIQFLKIE